MGQIIIDIPQSIQHRFQTSNKNAASLLIETIESVLTKLTPTSTKLNPDEDIVGIWRGRFPSETTVETGRRLRRGQWERF